MVWKQLSYKKLSLQETLDKLMAGSTLVVRGVESTNKGDILVRLDPRAVPVTQISYDVGRDEKSEYFKPYWVVYDIPFNFFVTRDVLEFTDDYRLYNPKFKVGDTVRYFYEDGVGNAEVDTAIVKAIFVDEDELLGTRKFYYNLSRVEYNIEEDNLTKL